LGESAAKSLCKEPISGRKIGAVRYEREKTKERQKKKECKVEWFVQRARSEVPSFGKEEGKSP